MMICVLFTDERCDENSIEDSSGILKHKIPIYQNSLFATGAQPHFHLNLNGCSTSDDPDVIHRLPDTSDSELEMVCNSKFI